MSDRKKLDRIHRLATEAIFIMKRDLPSATRSEGTPPDIACVKTIQRISAPPIRGADV